jgi:hypothetical protein
VSRGKQVRSTKMAWRVTENDLVPVMPSDMRLRHSNHQLNFFYQLTSEMEGLAPYLSPERRSSTSHSQCEARQLKYPPYQRHLKGGPNREDLLVHEETRPNLREEIPGELFPQIRLRRRLRHACPSIPVVRAQWWAGGQSQCVQRGWPTTQGIRV